MDQSKLSPSPEAPSEDQAQFHSLRSSRATSEPRSDAHATSPPNTTRANSMPEGHGTTYRSSRAESEVPQRDVVCSPTSGTRYRPSSISRHSSRASSEAPDRGHDGPDIPSPRRTPGKTKTSHLMIGSTVASRAGGRPVRCVPHVRRTRQRVRDHIQSIEQRLYSTARRSHGVYHYYQRLHYPFEDPMNVLDESAARTTMARTDQRGASENLTAEPKELSPPPSSEGASETLDEAGAAVATSQGWHRGVRQPSESHTQASNTTSSSSPSPEVDEALLTASFYNPDAVNESLEGIGEQMMPLPRGDDAALQSVSTIAMTTLLDPLSGLPVLGLCLGDYNGHIEYFEVSTCDANNSPIRRSKSTMMGSDGRLSTAGRHSSNFRNSASSISEPTTSIDSAAMDNITHSMRDREVLRRHSHKAFVKSLTALTSVAVEPHVKCLSFVRSRCSPSMVSYLTANERVIKLFHVRREGFSPLHVFPSMADVVGKTFVGSRYFSRLPPQPAIQPIKEYGPTENSIQALSVSADGETFMSVEDLQVFWWSFEASQTTRATCIADLRPASGAMDEVDELVTAASFHPTHSSLFLLTRSSGILNIGDLRDPPSRENRKYAISSRLLPCQNPYSCQAFDEILCNISDASFLGPDHVITRDYLSLKLWDLRKPDQPCSMVPVMNYVFQYLKPLYENDSIFDRFPVAVDEISGTVVTGLYDGAVAVWQPLSSGNSGYPLPTFYRVDPAVGPTEVEGGGVVSAETLDAMLSKSWAETYPGHSPSSSLSRPYGEAADGIGISEEMIPAPFVNKVLNVAIAPGGERFGYTYRDGRHVHIFERARN